MGSGAWFVLFPKVRLPSRDAVISTLTKENVKVLELGEMLFNITTDGGRFDLVLNTEPYVVIEAREAVDRNREGLDNADEVATYDARLELLFYYEDMGELFNPLLSAAERLQKLTSGEVYEPDNGVFQ